MADAKLSALTALTGANVDDANDLLYIDDVSVTTSKKILVRELKNSFLVIATEQASTSGTSIDFTGIPAGVRRITIMFKGVSTNGTSPVIVQIGDAGGPETSTYLGTGADIPNAAAIVAANYTTGFGVQGSNSATTVLHGSMILNLENASAFSWVANANVSNSAAAGLGVGSGSKSLSAELTQVRITTVNGSDTFDAGAIAIAYE